MVRELWGDIHFCVQLTCNNKVVETKTGPILMGDGFEGEVCSLLPVSLVCLFVKRIL